MNLSIPDAAAELGVSETRLRKTILDTAVPTLVEFRKTRTGVRKTTVLTPTVIADLRAHFEAPIASGGQAATELVESTPCHVAPGMAAAQTYAQADLEADAEEAPSGPTQAAPTAVPVSQFNALLYQHNVLKQELARVSDYLDGCDRLLGEMVRTIATLEERTRTLEPAAAQSRRTVNPVAGALRSASEGFRNALFSRKAAYQPSLRPSEVYYANVLAGR